MTLLPACPLMHGTGAFTSFAALMVGGRVTTLREPQVQRRRLLDTIAQRRVTSSRSSATPSRAPILAALDR